MTDQVREILERRPDLREQFGPAYRTALRQQLVRRGYSSLEADVIAGSLIRNAIFEAVLESGRGD